MPIRRGERFTYTSVDGEEIEDETYDTVDTTDVVYQVLRRLPKERIRKLMRDLGAVVLVSRPRSQAERAKFGPTPYPERVSLQVLGSVVIRLDSKAGNGSYKRNEFASLRGSALHTGCGARSRAHLSREKV